MIKKMILNYNTPHTAVSIVKNVIFDLSGVLVMKKRVEDMIAYPQSDASAMVVNFVETLSLLKACKDAGHRLFILSNLSVAEYNSMKQVPEIASLFSFFDDIVISDMTPYEKPSPQIFTYFCEQYSLQPSDCIFIDDKQDNLDGAQAANITKTILCSNFDLQHVRNELVNYGILQQSQALQLHIPTGQA